MTKKHCELHDPEQFRILSQTKLFKINLCGKTFCHSIPSITPFTAALQLEPNFTFPFILCLRKSPFHTCKIKNTIIKTSLHCKAVLGNLQKSY